MEAGLCLLDILNLQTDIWCLEQEALRGTISDRPGRRCLWQRRPDSF